jgi:hypothetical protein
MIVKSGTEWSIRARLSLSYNNVALVSSSHSAVQLVNEFSKIMVKLDSMEAVLSKYRGSGRAPGLWTTMISQPYACTATDTGT